MELLVALALLGIVLGVTGLALASLRTPREAEATRRLERARAEAIQTGHLVTLIDLPADTGANRAPRTTHVFLPDGRAVGPNVDPLTGAIHATR